MIKINKYILSLLLVALGIAACEKEFTPDLPTTADDVVVEGYVEAGDNALPTYVILTRSIPFFREIKNFNNLFETGAEVWVITDGDSVRLQEFCWKDIPAPLRAQAAQAFGFNIDSVGNDFNFCVYLDLLQQINGEVGKTYDLYIKTSSGKVLTARTTIPRPIPIDTAIFVKPPGINQNDTFAQMRATVKDPLGADYYRYFSAVNGSSYVAGPTSVTDDLFFDGLETTFNLFKSEPRGSGPNDNYGLWRRGDTISIKFCTIDKAHFDFWNTLEFNANSGGPFSSYTRVKHNVKGGLGIWGGYAVTYYDRIVPRN